MKHLKLFEEIGSPDLIIAVKAEKPSYVKLMLDHDHDPNCTDNPYKWTPLMWAAYLQNTEIMKMLIDAGADTHYKALHHIGGTKEMIDFYDLCLAKQKYEGGYKKTIKWIDDNYPEIVAVKKYNL